MKVFGAFKDIRFDERGLVPVIVQDAVGGAVLSLVYANLEALERTVESGLLWRYSRAKKELTQKGAASGNVQEVLSLALDCDSDAVLARVLPKGPACHTGGYSCFGTATAGTVTVGAARTGQDEAPVSKRDFPEAYMLGPGEEGGLGDEVDRMLEIK